MTLHLGLTPWSLRDTHTAQEIGRQGSLGEQWGYQSFWLPEHHFTKGSAIPDPLMLLASVAATTETLRLGTTSYLLPLRRPLLAAEQVAVLDRLSAGRVTLGIGRGYAPELFDVFGVERAQKRTLLRNCLQEMKRAWSGEPIGDGAGSTSIAPLPVQQPHPPIWVAAFGPLALKQAGSLGCPYLASPMETRRRLEANYALHRSACLDASQQVPTEVPIMRTVFCCEDKTIVRSVRERLDQESARLARSVSDDGRVPLTDDWSIVGDGPFVRDMVQRYEEELGITHLVATRLRIGGVPPDELESSVEAIAEAVLG